MKSFSSFLPDKPAANYFYNKKVEEMGGRVGGHLLITSDVPSGVGEVPRSFLTMLKRTRWSGRT